MLASRVPAQMMKHANATKVAGSSSVSWIVRQPWRALCPSLASVSAQEQAPSLHRQTSTRSKRQNSTGASKTPQAAADPEREKREKKVADDVGTIREQAKQHLEQLMSQLRTRQSSAQQQASASSSQMVAIRDKLTNAITAMQQGLVERDTEVRLLLLAAMAGEHILLVGPPGTAKSEVGRRLSRLIKGTYFERLLTRFSVPEELFGPLSMRALEEDKYVRQTTGYLPEAEVAFIDEIFKANSAILNTLLTLINERLFDNGAVRTPVPLVTVVGASNELPESEELDALFDRFLVRRQVKQVSAAGLAQMLTYFSQTMESGASIAAHMQLSRDDIRACKKRAVTTVKVPQSVIQLITDLRTYLQEKVEPPVYVSDRRLVKSIQLLQVAAYCNGRDTVTDYDALLLQHVLWQKPEQADRVHDWIVSQLSVDDGLKQVKYLLSGLFTRTCQCPPEATDKQAALLGEVTALRELLMDKYSLVAGSLEGGFPVVLNNLWLGVEEGEALATTLQPKLSKTRANIEAVLQEVTMLEVALKSKCDVVTLANLMPRQWADFIRNSPMDEVKPIGTTTLQGAKRP